MTESTQVLVENHGQTLAQPTDGPDAFAPVPFPQIDRISPICTSCGEVINNPRREGAITLTTDSQRWVDRRKMCVLENPRYHVHHRSERCAPQEFVRWSPLFSWWFDEFGRWAPMWVEAKAS
jgi:hypothetical protein